jgi:DNA-binding response OmpR family regulator
MESMMLSAKILLISADSEMTHAVTISLTQAGYEVVRVRHGAGALELIHTEKPKLVILDSQLPDYNSLAVIRALRSEEFSSRMPVILMGTTLTDEDVLLGLEVGADLCLQETFHPQVFIARVRSLLRRTELVKPY